MLASAASEILSKMSIVSLLQAGVVRPMGMDRRKIV